jgi:ribosomal protein S12 methylthiotransferase accessory factor
MANLFARAAALLQSEDAEKTTGSDARLLLEALGYAAAEAPADIGERAAETHNRACLLRAASRFARVFELAAPDAPGLVSFGAEFDPALAGGRPFAAGSISGMHRRGGRVSLPVADLQ